VTLQAQRQAPLPPVGSGSSVATLDGRSLARRSRLPLVVLAALAVVAVVVALLSGTSGSAADLDPLSATHGGSRALARLLAARGVTVRVAASVPAASPGERVAGSTLLVPDAARLAPRSLAAVRAAAEQTDVVVVDTDGTAADALAGGGVRTGDSGGRPVLRQPGCALPAAAVAGDARVGGTSFSVGRLPAGLTLEAACYADGGAPALVRLRTAGGSLTLLGAADVLRDDRLAADGDAALALGLLGTRPGVTWLLPGAGAAADDGGDARVGLLHLVPRGTLWLTGGLALALVLLALARGRRLGPVVREPLPVVVRSLETVLGRGRLYRGARARDRAADALREATRARIAARLALGLDTTPADLVTTATQRTGRDREALVGLLYGSPPVDDAALVRLARDLDDLVQEVAR